LARKNFWLAWHIHCTSCARSSDAGVSVTLWVIELLVRIFVAVRLVRFFTWRSVQYTILFLILRIAYLISVIYYQVESNIMPNASSADMANNYFYGLMVWMAWLGYFMFSKKIKLTYRRVR
jgi:hypothetical protein